MNLECQSCRQPFNAQTKIPKILTTCGHTICSECLYFFKNEKEHFICPNDKMVVLFFLFSLKSEII